MIKKRLIFGIFILIFFFSSYVVTGDEETAPEGFYEVRANIENSSVYLDEIFMGTIQEGILKIPVPSGDRPVNRKLEITDEGYEPYLETILQAPKPGETIVIRGTLRSLPITLTGSVSLAVSPPGGSVFIDGEQKGVVDQSGILVLRQIPAGNRILNVLLAGYEDHSERIYVEANLVNQIRINLIPLTTGSLQITSEPGGAQVKLNGALKGITPVTIPDLEQGVYQVMMTKDGYQSWTGQATVVAGMTRPSYAILQPVVTPVMTTPVPVPTTGQPTPAPTEAGAFPFAIFGVGVIIAFFVRKK